MTLIFLISLINKKDQANQVHLPTTEGRNLRSIIPFGSSSFFSNGMALKVADLSAQHGRVFVGRRPCLPDDR